MRYDVVVVGTGLAGLTAAVRSAEGGARVLVVAKGVGATHLAGGTIDVLGYDPDRVDAPGEALERLVAARPDHPYARIGVDALAPALEWLREHVRSGLLAPYAYAGGLDANLLLPTAVGVPKPTALAPETMLAGDMHRGGRVRVVGFRTLKDFHPALLADNLAAAELEAGLEAVPAELDLPADPGRTDLNALGLARRFDDPAFRGQVVGALAGRLAAEERVAMPAVLGLDDPHGAWTDLEHRLGRPVFEVPTLPPSVPGIRVFNSLREALRHAGGRLVMGAEVVGARTAGGRLEAVRVLAGGRETEHAAGEVVLATGGFASGGLDLDSRWQARERALGLPVHGAPGPGDQRFRPSYFDDHPMSRAGVAVDDELRPVDAAGDVLLQNVRVAGATLAGAVPWREKSGDGISLASGWRAAELVLGATGRTASGRAPSPAPTTAS